jgi:hypothetical protein
MNRHTKHYVPRPSKRDLDRLYTLGTIGQAQHEVTRLAALLTQLAEKVGQDHEVRYSDVSELVKASMRITSLIGLVPEAQGARAHLGNTETGEIPK